jgi:CubicO group peptidase (beta-lactamase class C family)
MKKKIIQFSIAFLLILNLAIWATGTTYIYNALLHLQANIDDLDIFEYRAVPNTGQRSPWLVSIDKNKKPLSDSLRKTLQTGETVAFLVIKNDSLCYEEYWDGYSDSSYSNSFSMAKSIISILVGVAIDEGKISSVKDPVGKYIPEYVNGELAKITIEDLLRMASGLNFHESYATPINQTTDAYYGNNLRKLMYSLKAEKPAGVEFKYKSGDTQLLGLVLSAATGKSNSAYASEKLWSKIGAEHDAKWSIDHADGDEKAFCCFYSNARDFARIGKLYLQKGRWKTQQLVDSNWVNQSISSNGLNDENGNKTDYYGYQWWVLKNANYPAFYCRGILGQYIVVVPSKNTIIVRLGKKRGAKIVDNQPLEVIQYVNELAQ